MSALLEIDGLALSRTGSGHENLVDGITLSVAAGETLGIIGESGSGKTLLSLACIGLLPPGIGISAGRIMLDGQDIGAASPPQMRHLRGRHVGMVFQEPLTALNPLMRIGAQLVEAVRAAKRMTRKQAVARAIELLEQVRFPDPMGRFDAYPHQLSGGLRQRVAIAIAIAGRPRVLIADEPTTALDATVQRDVLDMLGGLQRELGFAMLLISHDIGVVAQHTDRTAVLYAGRIMESGPTRDVLHDPAHPYTKDRMSVS